MMKRTFISVLAAFTFANVYIFAQQVTAPIPTFPKLKATDPLPSGLFVDLAKAINPAVVNVFTTYMPRERLMRDPYRDPFFDLFEQFMGPGGMAPRMPQQSLGTGFIIREDGLIVTNNHVVDKADIIKVQLEERAKEQFDAKVVGKDARTDIALIKVEAKRKLPYVRMGSSSEVQVGEWVAAFGNPYGYGHTMTKGIISAIGREIDELNLFPFMQTDASINPGNSGGPLVNTQGLVIGVNTAIDARAQGIGFVIPIDNVKSILPQLEKNGSIARGFIGVQMGEMDLDDEDAKSLNLKSSEGALIADVVTGSAAEKAGIEPYDLVVEFDGKKIASNRDLTKAVASTAIGHKAQVKLLRNGKAKTVTVEVSAPPDLRTALKGAPRKGEGVETQKAPFNLGFTVADYTPRLAQEFELPLLRQPRPVIVNVENGSKSAKAGLSPGDIILDVNRKEVARAKDVGRHLRQGTINILRVLKQDRVVLVSLRAS
jgi:serine protease Do